MKTVLMFSPHAYDAAAFAPRLADALAGGDVASLIISASIDDVVVLPWLPATATVVRAATMAREFRRQVSTMRCKSAVVTSDCDAFTSSAPLQLPASDWMPARTGAALLNVPYDDDPPWPVAADGAGHALVLVTHDRRTAARCDKVLKLDQGMLIPAT